MTKCSVCWDGSEAMMKYLPPHFTPLTFSPPFTVHFTSSIQVYETPFFVAVDHEKKKVVISIRGTLSPKVNFSFLILSLKYSPPPSKHQQKHTIRLQVKYTVFSNSYTPQAQSRNICKINILSIYPSIWTKNVPVHVVWDIIDLRCVCLYKCKVGHQSVEPSGISSNFKRLRLSTQRSTRQKKAS